ncbi:replication protein [Gallibacterium sp. ZY190522]
MSNFIPNSFQIPNAIIDNFLAKLSGNAFKCYALIARQTTGWQKQSDKISVSQFMKKCGIKNKKTAMKCLKELENINLILTFKNSGEINEFSLNFNPETPKSEPVPKNGTSTNFSPEPVPKNGTSTSTKNWYSTKDNIKNNITNNNPPPPYGGSPNGDHTVLQNVDDVKPKKRTPTKQKNNIDYQAILDFYNEQNELHGKRLPTAIDLNDKRKRGIVKILNLLKPSTLDGFKNYIEAFFERATEFYFGGNNRNWRASFDYLLREDTLTKVREEAL